MAFAVVLFFVPWASQSRAAEGIATTTDLPPSRRYEFTGFPIIGGNSDIGVQFGGAATLTRFYDEALPYLWNVDLLLSASVKDDQTD